MKKLLLALSVLAAIAAVAAVVLVIFRKKDESTAWVEEFSNEEEIF